MGNVFGIKKHNDFPAGGDAGLPDAAAHAQQVGKPTAPPPTVYFNPLQKAQVVKDAYDSSLQQSRFQFQSPEHF